MITRKQFLLSLGAAALPVRLRSTEPEAARGRVLPVVAHPDDEYTFAATVYRLSKELHWTVDQLVVTNGEAGYRNSRLAEQFYEASLTKEEAGRSRLPEIRKRETLAAGRILGIRNHYFLEQKDQRFTLNPAEALDSWDRRTISAFLKALIEAERYSFVFTMLPTSDTHGHHKAATLLALHDVHELPEDARPVVLGGDPAVSSEPARSFDGLAGYPETKASGGAPVFNFDGKTSFGLNSSLNYQIVVNWAIAEHKSQGLFQADCNKHDEKRFWLYGVERRESARTDRAVVWGAAGAAIAPANEL